MNLNRINYQIPNNYSATPVVVLNGDDVLFEGLLHRVNDIDGVEGTHDEPVRLERDGEYFDIPSEWRRAIPQYPGNKPELVRC